MILGRRREKPKQTERGGSSDEKINKRERERTCETVRLEVKKTDGKRENAAERLGPGYSPTRYST